MFWIPWTERRAFVELRKSAVFWSARNCVGGDIARDLAILAFLIATGMRPSEMRALSTKDVLAANAVRIKGRYGQRIVPLGKRYQQQLEKRAIVWDRAYQSPFGSLKLESIVLRVKAASAVAGFL
jgi:integrase